MTKIFTNAILITSTAFVAFMIVTPLGHLSAENQTAIDVTKKVHKAIIQGVESNSQSLAIEIDGAFSIVNTNASTTILSSDGDPIDITALRSGSSIYVFGYYDPVAKSIYAEKVVVCNKSKTGRTSLSKAELRKQSQRAAFAPADDLGLTVK
jgi:hypothetical protein